MKSGQKQSQLAAKLKMTLDADQLTNCMRCGFCQSACPTFLETGLEAASPRGRIALMKAVADGLMEPDQAFRDQIDLCLGCRACEPACPSDVKYGQLLEQTKEAMATERKYSLPGKLVRKVFLEGVFPHPGKTRALGHLLKFYQKSGMRRVAQKSGFMNLFPEHMREMEAILPEAGGDGVIGRWLNRRLPAYREQTADGGMLLVVPPVGEKVGRVALFRGCIMDVLFTSTNVNTIRLLRQAGFEIVVPDAQSCCGALHSHTGELEAARRLALRNIRAFAQTNADAVVTNAGGCGAMLKEYNHLLHKDRLHREEAADFASKVKDVTELLNERKHTLQMKPYTSKRIVTYQDSCHLRNVMRIRSQPRQLLQSIPGVEFREMQGADRCCGSAGIYNLLQPEMSSSVLDHKMEKAEATQAELIVTSNPGCLLQMKWGIHRTGKTGRMKAVHLVDLLAESVVVRDHLAAD